MVAPPSTTIVWPVMKEPAFDAKKTADVVIVGAGAAGIAAARRLAMTGLSAMVLEATARVGGRAWTCDVAGLRLDLGCGWLHSANRNPWTRIAEAAGFAVDEAARHSTRHLAPTRRPRSRSWAAPSPYAAAKQRRPDSLRPAPFARSPDRDTACPRLESDACGDAEGGVEAGPGGQRIDLRGFQARAGGFALSWCFTRRRIPNRSSRTANAWPQSCWKRPTLRLSTAILPPRSIGDREASAPASSSRGPGNGILRAETGGRIQARTAGERSEFGSQTPLRLTNPPELRGLL